MSLLADASSAVDISKKKFDALPPDMQNILVKNGKIYLPKLAASSRKENARSIEVLKNKGIKLTEIPSKDVISTYDEVGKKARRLLVGKLYDESFMNKVEASLTDFRKAKK